MSLVFWAWTTIAIVCVLSEAVAGGLFMLPWAFGAGLAAVLEASGASSTWQWIGFLGLSSVLFVVAQRFIVKRPK